MRHTLYLRSLSRLPQESWSTILSSVRCCPYSGSAACRSLRGPRDAKRGFRDSFAPPCSCSPRLEQVNQWERGDLNSIGDSTCRSHQLLLSCLSLNNLKPHRMM